MMLVVENWEKGGELQHAMLLDASPSAPHGDDRAARLEPWAAGGALAACLRSARAVGRASLVLVFQSDARATWGARKVTAVAGGGLYADARPGVGLRYEVVARGIFRNVVGEDTALPYRVLVDACLATDPDRAGGKLVACGRKHPLLGYPVPIAATGEGGGERRDVGFGDDPSLGTGVRIKWIDQTGYSEDWFVADEKGAQEFQFWIDEFARRQYVQLILAALGFVEGLGASSRDAMVQSVLGGALPQLQALKTLLCQPGPSLDERDLQPKSLLGASPAPAPAAAATDHSPRVDEAVDGNGILRPSPPVKLVSTTSGGPHQPKVTQQGEQSAGARYPPVDGGDAPPGKRKPDNVPNAAAKRQPVEKKAKQGTPKLEIVELSD